MSMVEHKAGGAQMEFHISLAPVIQTLATSDIAPARSIRGSDHALPSRRGCAGRQRGWRRSEPQPSGRRPEAIRSTRRARRAVSCPRAGTSRFLPALTIPRYRQGAALQESTVKCGAIMQPFRFRTKVSTPDAIARTWRAGCHRELWFGFAA